MVATTDLENLQRLREELYVIGDDTQLEPDDDLGRFYGRNEGNGVARVSSQRRLVRMGVPEEFAPAAQRGIAAHELLVHGYDKEVYYNGRGARIESVSDRDEAGHKKTHRMAMNILGEVDPEAAYAMRYVKWGGDGGDELSEYMKRYGGGLANGKEKNIFVSMYRSLLESLVNQYKPLHEPIGNAKEYVLSEIKSLMWGIPAALIPETNIFGKILRDTSAAHGKKALKKLQDMSPLIRSLTIGYGSGRTNLDRLYVYKDGDGIWPVFYTTFGNETPPTLEQLGNGIKYVNDNRKSPMHRMTKSQASDLINSGFEDWQMKYYLTSELHDRYFKDEMETVLNWLVREDTKDGGLWKRDNAAESTLPSVYQGNITVWRKNVNKNNLLYWLGDKLYGDKTPKSWDMARSCIAGDFGQDLASAYGMFNAGVLESIGAPAESIRRYVLGSFKRGSEYAEGFGGGHKFFKYSLN